MTRFRENMARWRATLRYARKAVKNGFLHILTAKTLAQCMSALSALLLPGLMTAGQFGTLSNPDNILNYVMIFNGLGMSVAVMRYCAVFDSPGEKRAYFKFGLKFGFFCDAFLVLAASAVIMILDRAGFLRITASEWPIIMGFLLLPFFAYCIDCTQSFLRSCGDNKGYARTATFFSAVYAVFQVVLVFFWGLGGVVPGRNLAYAAAAVFTLFIAFSSPVFKDRSEKYRLSRQDRRAMVRFGLSSMLANTFSLILPQNEQFIFNHFVTNFSSRAQYKVAGGIPQSIQFIAISVAFFIYPYFAKHYKDGKWIRHNSRRLFIVMSAGMAFLAGIGIILTPWILRLYPGGNYCTPEAVAVMRIFWVTFAVNGALKMTAGNILAAVGEIRFNLFTAFFSSTVHLAICWACIGSFGMYGAAYGLLSAYVLIAVASVIYLEHYTKRLEKSQNGSQCADDEDIEADEKELL